MTPQADDKEHGMANIVQINNLRLKKNRGSGKYEVVAPDKRVLEEFSCPAQAMQWMCVTTDFVQRK